MVLPRSFREHRDDDTGFTCCFCIECGSPITYQQDTSPHMVNIPRGLFAEGVGREPLYHVRMKNAPDWAYRGEKLSQMKNYPTILYERPKKPKNNRVEDDMF